MKRPILILLCMSPLCGGITQAAEHSPGGKPIPELRGVLVNGKTELDRLNAAKALEALIPAKQRPDPRLQQPTVTNSVSPDVVAALLPGLADSACSVRYVCRQALGRGGPSAEPPRTRSSIRPMTVRSRPTRKSGRERPDF
jgi:hypothetical protein